ncbi:MAG TPA: hypothetical protein PLI16_04255 [Bacteroidales bacterium]|nr:hypothetical protein [Bacteroidales bacterium]HOH83801.1 hypothetical protein [Bacteroidales bacterium]
MNSCKVLLFFVFLTLIACQSVREPQSGGQANSPSSVLSTGRVSHQYRATGCLTVIIVDKPGESLVLIPYKPLAAQFDKDGLVLKFDYRLLKMPNPKGCEVGIPAELSNVAIKQVPTK